MAESNLSLSTGDHGYDVSDYFDVEPMFGSLEEFDRMIADLHQRGIMILMDIVPNHVSSQHEWFQSALSGGIGNPDEKRFIIREGPGDGGMNPPNDWISIFGGSSWSPFPSSEGSVQRWYLHMFDPCQPDLNWHHRDVRERFENILRFWLDRGVDGFRVDVAHGLFKAPGLPNREGFGDNWSACWDQPEVHDIYRKWREIIEGYEPSRFLIGEIHTATRERLLEYLRANQLHAAFDFSFLHQDWDGDGFRDRIRLIWICGEIPDPCLSGRYPTMMRSDIGRVMRLFLQTDLRTIKKLMSDTDPFSL